MQGDHAQKTEKRQAAACIAAVLALTCAVTPVALGFTPKLSGHNVSAAHAAKPVTFILGIRPARKPGQIAAPAKQIAKAKTETPVLTTVAATARPLAPQPSLVVSADAPEKEPSLLKRMFATLGGPERLSEADAGAYNRIFALQDTGQFGKADAESQKLTNPVLMGNVLYQRYTRPDYTSSYKELADWMAQYGDLPNAQRIADLAQAKKKKGDAGFTPARTGKGIYSRHDFDVGQLAQPYSGEQHHTPRQRDVIRAVDDAMSENPTGALRRLDAAQAKNLFDNAEYDALRAEIASSYFYNGKTQKAYELAAASAQRSNEDVPLAGWIGGLSAWQLGKYKEAAKFFEVTANSNRTSAWMSAAGAHWAARSYLRAHEPQKVSYWLHRSANYPRTFYGIISMKALGMEQEKFNWQVPELAAARVKALTTVPAGRRALALVDTGRLDLAEQELRQINPGDNETLQESLVALTQGNGMPGLAMKLGSTFRAANGNLYDAALYPDVPWMPQGGFRVDRALVYAFIRQESKFEPAAFNKSSGAIGLMQLMPDTARYVARHYGLPADDIRLQDPMVNIDLGQKYLAELLRNEYVGNNLFKLAVAFNAGPGKLARWEQTAKYADDPLLFIESIPVQETRIFVERVLANYWIYRIKYHQDTESLDKVAEGNWPIYLAQDDIHPDLRAAKKGPRLANASEILAR